MWSSSYILQGDLIEKFYGWSSGKTQDEVSHLSEEMNDSQKLIIRCINSKMSIEVRRALFKCLTLVCENAKTTTKVEPYMFVLDGILKFLEGVSDDKIKEVYEELYELLGDCCYEIYNIDRDTQRTDETAKPSVDMSKPLDILLRCLKHHNSFDTEAQENLSKARALESMLLAMADIFSFYRKLSDYDAVTAYVKDR